MTGLNIRPVAVTILVTMAGLLLTLGCHKESDVDGGVDDDVDRDTDVDVDSDADTDGDRDGDTDADRDGDTDGDRDGDTDRDAYSSRAIEITIDGAQTYQTMHGIGASTNNYMRDMEPALYDPVMHSLYINELRASVARIGIDGDIIYNDNNPVALEEIDYQKAPWDFEALWMKWHMGELSKDQSRSKRSIHWAKHLVEKDPTMKIIGSSWSPPSWMKENKQTVHGSKLLEKYIPHYARFLAQWVKGLKEVYNIDVYAISLQNEPLFTQSYASCTYPSDGILYRKVFVATVDELKNNGLTARLFGPEDMTRFPERVMGYVEPILSDPEYSEYLTAIAAHGYTDGVTSDNNEGANKLWSLIKPHNKEYWMTETGYGENETFGTENSGITYELGGKLFNMIAIGNASLITMWTFHGSEPSQHSCITMINSEWPAPGEYVKGLRFYVFKHFARNIRPGMVRVDADPMIRDDFQVMAFHHKENGRLTIILNKHENSETALKVSLKNLPPISTLRKYITDGSASYRSDPDIEVVNNEFTITMSRSLVSLVHGE